MQVRGSRLSAVGHSTRRNRQILGPFVLVVILALGACAGSVQLQTVDVLPYQRSAPLDLSDAPVDSDGVHVYERNGSRHRHPVAQTQFAINLLEAWRHTGEAALLDQAALNATDLLAHAHGDFLPYTFDFPLHGDTSNTIHAPWYSAMAQGQFLSLSVRLYEATTDDFWLDTANRMFDSLAEVHTVDRLPSSPWVTFEDELGYLWFEEYAGDVPPMKVLNGHIFAMFGLYDFWRISDSKEASELFDRGAETVDQYVPLLRVEGEPSWYGMRIQDNPIAQSETYHRIHIGQLRMLARMTGEDTFSEYANLLEKDFS